MRSAYYQPWSDSPRTSRRRRAAALLLALAVEALLVLMLLHLAPSLTRPPGARSGPVSFRLLPDIGITTERTKTVRKAGHAGGRAAARTHVPPAKAAAKPPPTPMPPVLTPNFIPLTTAEFEAADIAKLPAHAPASRTAAAGAGDGTAGKDSAAVGGGAGGEQLYDAEWYVEPTHAQLAYYLPAGGSGSGWGMIACRTVAHYEVDDCHELGESPLGSGLARAVRQAAWQFRVLPPRIGGHPVVGAWVRIRIDYREAQAR